MFGAAPFGRLLYSGAPVEHVERSATVQFSCSTLVLLFIISLTSVSAIQISASAFPVSVINANSVFELSTLSPPAVLAVPAYAILGPTSEARTSYSTTCTSSISIIVDVSVVSSAVQASTALEIESGSKPSLTLQGVAEIELIVPSFPASISTIAYSSFALATLGNTISCVTASSAFEVGAFIRVELARTAFLFEAASSPALTTQALANIYFESTAIGLSGELSQGYTSFVFTAGAKPYVIIQGQALFSCTAESWSNLACKATSELAWETEASPYELFYGFAESKILIESAAQSISASRAILSLSITSSGFAGVATTTIGRLELCPFAYAIERIQAIGEAAPAFLASAQFREARSAISAIQIDNQASVSVSLIARTEAQFANQAFPLTSEFRSGHVELEIEAVAKTSSSIAVTVTLIFRPYADQSISAKAAVSISVDLRKSVIRERGTGQFTISSLARSLKLSASFTFLNRGRPARVGRALARLSFHAQGIYPGLVIPTYEIRLKIGGVDLSERVKSWNMRFNFDAGAWTLDLELTNHEELVAAKQGLAPWDPISEFNKNGPLLGRYNQVEFYIREEHSSQWLLLFNGFVGPTTVDAEEVWGEADTVRVTCVGPSQPLKDWMIEERLALRYTDAPLAKASFPNDLLNQIVRDQGFDIVIHYKDEPSYFVTEYIISNVSLWEALENALAPTGFRLIEYLDLANGGLKLMVVDPLRFDATVDRVLLRYRSRRISGSEADVRTWVGVVYRDRFDFQEKLVWAEASPEIVALYGIPDGKGGKKHRKMVYRTSDRSLVDTESEARELAAMILWDLETPSPSIELEIPWIDLAFWPFQLLLASGSYMETLIGVQEIEWSWSWERPCGETRIRGAAGRVVGAKNLWFSRDPKKARSRESLELEGLYEQARWIEPNRPTVVGAWFQHQDGSPKPVVDVLLAEPPPWARAVVLKIYRFEVVDSGTVSSSSGREIRLLGKSYTPGEVSGPSGDHLIIRTGELAGRIWKIQKAQGSYIWLSEDPGVSIAANTEVIIGRLRRLETKTFPITRYIRIEDVREGEIIGVSYSWARFT